MSEQQGPVIDPRELSPQPNELLGQILDTGYTRFATWGRHLQKRGQYTAHAPDRSRQIGSVGNEALSKFISEPVEGVFSRLVETSVPEAEFFKEHPIVEAIFSTPLTTQGEEDEIQTETIYEKGLFGKEKPKLATKVVKVPKGDLEPIPFNKLVTGPTVPDLSEPAVLFGYTFFTGGIESAARAIGVEGIQNMPLKYKDFMGREGNQVSVSVVLPQGLADKLTEELKTNPLFMREVAIGIRDKKTIMRSDDYIEPPFDEVKGKGLEMYLALDAKISSEPKGKPHVFDPANVVSIDSL